MQEEYLKKRTLYLINRGDRTIVKRDGPSVLIERRYCAPVRIPANYIDKVVIYGNVEMDAFSLTLFSSSQIPVLIIGRHDESSIILPYNHDTKTNSKQQRTMLASEKVVQAFISWNMKKRQFNQTEIINKLFTNISISINEGEENYQTLLNKIKPSDFLWNLIKGIMKNLMIITILAKLIHAKLDPHIGILHQNYNYGLVFDVYNIYEPIADYLTFQFFYADGVNTDFIQNPQISSKQLHRIVEKFEKQKQHIEYKLNETIAEIFHFMRQITP